MHAARLKFVAAFCLAFLLATSLCFAQRSNQQNPTETAEQIAVDSTLWNHALSAKGSQSNSIPKLTEYLLTATETDHDRAKIIYYWLIQHKKRETAVIPMKPEQPLTAEQALKHDVLSSYDMALLCNELLQTAKLNSVTVSGYIKNPSTLLDSVLHVNHYWNAVKVNQEWCLLDASWGAGFFVPKQRGFQRWLYYGFNKPYVLKKLDFVAEPHPEYFHPDPADFAASHLPADPVWQLLDHPLPVPEFTKESTDIPHYLRLQEMHAAQPLDCYKEIRTYFAEVPNERALHSAQNAYRFHPNNVGIKAEGHGTFGLLKLEDAANTATKDTTRLIRGYKIAEKHLGEAETNFKLESRANRSEHKDLLNINKKYNKFVNAEVRENMRTLQKIADQNSKRETKLQRIAKELNQDINKLEGEKWDIDEEAILDVNRRASGDPAELAAKLAENERLVKEHLKAVTDNVEEIERLDELLAESAAILEENYDLLQDNSQQYRDQQALNLELRIQNLDDRWAQIRYNRNQLESLLRLKRALHAENEMEEAYVLKPVRKKREALRKDNVKHLKTVCKLISSSKKMSAEDLFEDQHYASQAMAMKEEKDRMIEEVIVQLNMIQDEFRFLKAESKLIGKEQKLLTKEEKIDRARMRWAAKVENKRYRDCTKKNQENLREVGKGLERTDIALKALKSSGDQSRALVQTGK